MDKLKAEREEDSLTQQQQRDLQDRYRELWNEMQALIPQREQDDVLFNYEKIMLIEHYEPDRVFK